MEFLFIAYVIWTLILLGWSRAIISDTKTASNLIQQARNTAKDNLRLFSTRNELRNVSFIFNDGNVKTYSARGYRHEGSFYKVYDADGNIVIELSDKKVAEVRLTRGTEYTYLEPQDIGHFGEYYARNSINNGYITELRDEKGGD